MPALILKRASSSRRSGEWNDDDFDVLADGAIVGRIFKANAAPVGTPRIWTSTSTRLEGRAMAAFASMGLREAPPQVGLGRGSRVA
jgi:hypothetical protein